MRPRLPNTEGKEYYSPIPQNKKRQYRQNPRKLTPKALSLRPPEALQDEGHCWYLSKGVRQHRCNNQDLFAEFTPSSGLGTVALSAIQPDGSLEVIGLINILYDSTAPVNLVSLSLVRSRGIQFDPLDCILRDPNSNFVAYASLIYGIHQLQIAATKPPPSALDDLAAIAAEWPKDHFTTAAVTPSAPEAHCDSVASEPSSEDRSAIAAFNDFNISLSEAHSEVANIYNAAMSVPALDPSDLGAPDAPQQDTSSEEGLLDEEDSTSSEHGIPCRGVLSDSSSAVCSVDDDVGKPSSLEATEVLESPGTASQLAVTEALTLSGIIYEQSRCADRCDPKTSIARGTAIPIAVMKARFQAAIQTYRKPSRLEAMKALALPGTTINEKPSRLEAAKDLALPGIMTYEKPSRMEATEALALPGTTKQIRSSRSNQLRSGLDRSVAKCDTQKPTKVAITPSNRKSTMVAIIIPIRQLAATCTSYALFNPGGGSPYSFLLLPLLLATMRQQHLPCLFDWHLRKPALQQRPPQLLGTEDINGYWVEEGVGQAIAGGGGMGKELGIAVAVLYSTATVGLAETSSEVLYDGLEQCTPYGGATPRKPSLSGGTMITLFDPGGVPDGIQNVTPLLSASRNSYPIRKPSLFGGTQFYSTPYGGANQQKPSLRGNRKSTTYVANQQLAAERTSNHPFDPGGLSSVQSWLIDLFYPSSFVADLTQMAHGQWDINRNMLGGLWGC
ncbi:MAG: hypothetical protein M1836_001975 [Candelina mexicana]|nr:MAG: hypothetical protein M1836_001975 [Candelina mexicana]